MHRRPFGLLTLSAALAGLLVLGACGDRSDGGTAATPSAGAVKIEKPIESGKLTACSDIPYAPFEFEEDGKVQGIDVDLVTAIAKELGLEADFRDTDFDGIFASLAAGNCDIIASSVSITDERKKANDFTAGYFEINQSMLVRKDDATKYKDFAGLKGKTIGVQSETTGAEYATTEAAKVGAEVKEFTGADELFTALKAKQIDAVVQDFPVNSYNATTTGDTVVSATFEANEAEQYGFVVPKSRPKLLAAMNTALEGLHTDGSYDKIMKQYLGDNANVKN